MEKEYFHGPTAPISDIAVQSDYFISTSNDSTARLWCLNNRSEPRIFRHQFGPVLSVDIASKGHFSTGSEKGVVSLWDVTEERFITRFNHNNSGKPISKVRYSSMNNNLLASLDGNIRLLDTRTAKTVMNLKEYSGHFTDFEWSPMTSDSILASCSEFIREIDIRKQKAVDKYSLDNNKPISSIQIDPSNRFLLSTSNRSCSFTNLHNHQVLFNKVLSDEIVAAKFSPNGQRFAIANRNGNVRVSALDSDIEAQNSNDSSRRI